MKPKVIFITNRIYLGNMHNQRASGGGSNGARYEALEGEYGVLKDRLILVVGSSDDVVNLSSRLSQMMANLEGMECGVGVESTVDQALERVESATIECVVSEYQLDEGDGLELLKEVRERAWNIPFVLWTGSGSEEIASEATANNVTDYLPKSVADTDSAKLLERIEETISDKVHGSTDPAEQRNRELALERQRFFYDRIQDEGGIGLFEIDPENWSVSLSEGLQETREYNQIDDPSVNDALEFVHPDDRDRVKALVRRAIEEQEPYEAEYGLLDSEGNDRYVSNRAQVLTDTEGETTLVRGISQDVTEQRVREKSLEAVSDVARGALQMETVEEIAHMVVDAGSGVLELAGPTVYLYDDQRGELYPAACSCECSPSELARFGPGDGLPWRVFEKQTVEALNEIQPEHDIYDTETGLESALAVPLGGHGVLVVGTEEATGLDDVSVVIAQILAATAEAALDRVAQLDELRRGEKKSQEQAEKLNRLNQLNEQIRTINQTITQAESHGAIDQSVCDSLVDLDRFDFAWIAEPDYAQDSLTIKAQSDTDAPYLAQATLGLDVEDAPPAVRAVEQREPVLETNIAGGIQNGDWQSTAFAHGFRCAISVPLLHDDVLYGVLTVYSEEVGGFEEMTRNVLAELGGMIGFAHQTVSQRDALVSTDSIDITLSLEDRDEPFVRLAAAANSNVSVRNITSRTDDTYLVYFSTHGTRNVEKVIDVACDLPIIEEIRSISGSDSDVPMFEAVAYRDSSLFEISDLGAELLSATATEQSLSVELSVPRTEGVQSFVDRVRNRYPSAVLQSQREGQVKPSTAGIQSPFDVLTDRQREILDAAYYAGFFDMPRGSSGTEVADSLGITQAGFSKQRRIAIRNLLEILYE